MDAPVPYRAKRWSRKEYDRLIERAGIADYWILNLVDRVLEIHREPVRARSARFGWRYASVQSFGPEDAATPLAAPAAPGAPISVADLLP